MEFAKRMGWHIVTLGRYETTRPPKGRALADLEKVAGEHGHSDLAAIFQRHLIDELGLSSLAPEAPTGHHIPERFVVTRDDSVDVLAAVSAFIDILVSPRDAWLREKILDLVALAQQPKEPEEEVLNERQQVLGRIFGTFPDMPALKAEALAQALPFGIGGVLRYGPNGNLESIDFEPSVVDGERTRLSVRQGVETIDPKDLAEINRASPAYAPLKRRVESIQSAKNPKEKTSERQRSEKETEVGKDRLAGTTRRRPR
jgi:hypothetical protein